MKKLTSLIAILFCVFQINSYSQTSLNIYGTFPGNGAIKQYTSSNNTTGYSSQNSVYSGTDQNLNEESGNYVNTTYRSIETFDVSGIPVGSQIVSAKLIFYGYRAYTSGDSKTKITIMTTNSIGSLSSEAWFNAIGNATALQTGVENSGLSVTIDILGTLSTAYNSASKKIYLGYVNENEGNVKSYTSISGELLVKYNPPPTITIVNSFGSGSLKVDGLTYTSGTQFTTWAYNSTHNIEGLNQTINGTSYTFQNWSDGTTTSTTNPKTITVTTNKTWTANFAAARVVTFANRDGNTIVPNTTLTRNSTDLINSGDSRSLSIGSNHLVQTNHEKLPSTSKKHNRWNANLSEYKLSHTIDINIQSFEDNAQFEPLSAVTLTPSLDGIPVAAPIDVKDPWFVEADGTQLENYKTYNSGFNSATMPNGGIFLQPTQTVSSPSYPYYTARTTNYQVISGVDSWFNNWSSPNSNVTSPNSLETPVIFKNANETITANYKGHLRTGQPNSSDAKNQRRLVASPYLSSAWFMTYQSMGDIWSTSSLDEGVNWSAEKKLNVNSGLGVNPSISNLYASDNSDFKRYVISWVENGQVFFQLMHYTAYHDGPFYGWVSNDLQAQWPNRIIVGQTNNYNVSDFDGPQAVSDARPVVQLVSNASTIDIQYAYEAVGLGVVYGKFSIPKSGNYIVYDFNQATQQTFSGLSYKQVSTSGSFCPVFVSYPTLGANNPGRNVLYFVTAEGATAGTNRIAQYDLSNFNKTYLSTASGDKMISSLQAAVCEKSTSFILASEVMGSYVKNVNIYYSYSPYTVSTLPILQKVFTDRYAPTVMAENVAGVVIPNWEVNMRKYYYTPDYWYKHNGTSETQISSALNGIIARGNVQVSDRKTMVVSSASSPAAIKKYSGSGTISKESSTLVSNLKSVIEYTDSENENRLIVLDFSGAKVEPVDGLESGQIVSAVRVINADESGIIVSQPDSIIAPVAVDLKRGDEIIRSYSSQTWNSLGKMRFPI